MGKTIGFIMVFTLLSQLSLGQNCKVFLVKRESVMSGFITTKPLTKDDSTNITLLQDDPYYVDLEGFVYDHSAVKEHNLVIQFFDKDSQPLTNQAVGINSVTLKEVSTGIQYDIPSQAWDLTKPYILIKLKEHLGDKPKNGEKIQLRIQTIMNEEYIRYFKYINGWQPYNFANNKIGLWFPVNMYSSSFKRGKNGVLFTSMPIGLAIGGKYNISQKFYIGFSGTLNYTIANASDTTTTKSYFLQDFSVGPLIDLGGYVYIGYTYPVNLTDQPVQLKPQFVIGLGVNIIQLLKGR